MGTVFFAVALHTSQTPDGRGATFQGPGFSFFFQFVFDLNCCTIRFNISIKKNDSLSRLEEYTPFEASSFVC